MLQQLRAAFELSCDTGQLPRNPCRLVKPPARVARVALDDEENWWSAAEVGRFLAVADADRLAAAWRLALYGMRRGEVCGLRWSDADLKGGTLTIANTRVLVDYKVIKGAEVQERAAGAALVAALEALQSVRAAVRKIRL